MVVLPMKRLIQHVLNYFNNKHFPTVTLGLKAGCFAIGRSWHMDELAKGGCGVDGASMYSFTILWK